MTRTRARIRAVRPTGAVVVLATLAAVVVLAGAPPAAAQVDEDGGTGELELLSQTMWVEPDGDVSLLLDIGDADPGDRIEVTIHDRLGGRFALDDSLSGTRLGPRLRTLGGTVEELDPDGDGRVEVAFGLRGGAGEPERLLVTREGLHPVAVTHVAESGEAEGGFVTHVVRLPTEVDHELGLAVVQPLEAPPSLQPDGTVDIDTDVLARLTSAANSFGTDTPIPVTFQLTGETVAALDASGLPLNRELLDSLTAAAATGTIASSPFVDIDVDDIVRAGMAPVVGEQLGLGHRTIEEHLGRAPVPGTWVADDSLGPDGLAELTRHGVRRVVVPHSSLDDPPAGLLVQPFELVAGDARVTALATDPSLQSHAGSTGSAVLDAQHLLADLAAIWLERPAYERGTVVVLPSSTTDQTTFVQSIVEGIASSPLLAPGSVQEVIAAADPAAVGGIDATVDEPDDRLTLELSARDDEDATDLAGYRGQREATARAVASFSTVFVESPRVDDYRERVASSVAAGLDRDDRRRYLAAVRDDVAGRLASLGMPDRGAITLPSRDGVIPLTLVNDTGSPATLVIRLDSDKLEFPQGDRIEITLTEAHTPIEIPVQVRSSGAFPLDMSLESPDGRVQLVDSRYTVRSTAVSGLGIALSVSAVLVLGAWWFRTARRARAAHRAAEATDRDEPTPQ